MVVSSRELEPEHVQAVCRVIQMDSDTAVGRSAAHIGVEVVVFCRQHHFLHVLGHSRHSSQTDAVVGDSQQLMHHRLVRPLHDNDTPRRRQLLVQLQQQRYVTTSTTTTTTMKANFTFR